MLLNWALGKVATIGRLTLTDAAGRTRVFEGAPGPACAVRLHNRRLHTGLAVNPWLRVGEAYMDGTLTVEEGTLGDFIEFCCVNARAAGGNPAFRLAEWLSYRLRRIQQHNPVGRARRNAAHHYDLSGALYDLFLDEDRQYSCAYFTDADETLEAAQANKKRHLASKLLLAPGQTVLDVGSGWGGLALYLARLSDVEVTGLTLSEEQRRVSEGRAKEAGLADRVRFHLRDYRQQTGRFDRIVSVGMFEHVGAGHYREFFASLRGLLAEDGVALLHAIGRMEPPGTTSAWLRKYIFPGGYTPALSEVLAAVEREGLYVTDVEILRLHYAQTLRHWHDRFQANRGRAAEIYDERFCRMWEFYLKGCEMAFKHWNQMVFQMQLAHRQEAAPPTRDYMVDWERARRAEEEAGEEAEGARAGAAA